MSAFTIRPFHNTDPPQILELLRRAFPLLAHSMSSLQEGIFALPYSEYSGFFVAVEESRNQEKRENNHQEKRILGFALAGAAPHSDMMRLDCECGLIRFVVLDPEADDALGLALVETCENFLQQLGAKKIVAGIAHAYFPFFMGFFGLLEPLCATSLKTAEAKTSLRDKFEPRAPHDKIEARALYDKTEKITDDNEDDAADDATPICLRADTLEILLARVLALRGFRPQNQVHRFFFPLENSFRPKLTAKVARQRSALELVFSDNPKPRHWWDACLMAYHQWVEVTAYPHATTLAQEKERLKNPVARLVMCISVPREISLYNAPRRAGLVDVYVAPEYRRSGVMSHLLGETLRFLAQECRVKSVEAYVAAEFAPMISFLTHAGWQSLPVSEVLVKEF